MGFVDFLAFYFATVLVFLLSFCLFSALVFVAKLWYIPFINNWHIFLSSSIYSLYVFLYNSSYLKKVYFRLQNGETVEDILGEKEKWS
jgi:hypothetical protein